MVQMIREMNFRIKKHSQVFRRDGTVYRGMKIFIFLDLYVLFWKDITLVLLILILIQLAEHQPRIGSTSESGWLPFLGELMAQ
jgi:hypothetical protein